MADSRRSSLAQLDYYDFRSASPSNYSADGTSAHPSAIHSRAPSASYASGQPQHLRQQSSLAHIAVPSFSAFRSQASSIPVSSSASPSRRKQLPFQAHSPRAPSASIAELPSPRLVQPGSRPFSTDSPGRQQSSGLAAEISPNFAETPTPKQDQSASYTYTTYKSHQRTDSIDSRIADSVPSSSAYGIESRRSSIPIHARYAQEHSISHAPRQSVSSLDFTHDYSPAQRLSAVSSMNGKHTPPEMKLELEGVQRTLTDESIGSTSDSPNNGRPKSPGGSRWNLFGRKGSGQKGLAESPSTTFSDRSISPIPSPGPHAAMAVDSSNPAASRGLAPPGLDIQKANTFGGARREYFDNPETPILIGSPETNAHVKELERELAHVSSELASSVKREMELEDELDRVRTEPPASQALDAGRRTSDYFSDSGASSTRYPISDVDSKLEQLERNMRKVEQEKAQIKVEMASRLQTELSRRRDLEQMVQHMEEQLQRKFDEDDEHRDAEERIDELESTLEDTRRLLNQERQAKGSFEDLYTATRGELEQHRNERDNLRDEVVPSLRARVEGLEAESTDTQALVYENTRMQQELIALKERMGGRFGSIVEEDGMRSPMMGGPRANLSRSGSLARTQSKRGGSLTRSGSVKEREGGRHRSGSISGDAVKEIEDQRDALHKALKLLIIRCEKQQREHERAIKKLNKAKTQAEHFTPNRTAYHREVSFLKDEVTTLRKRTEDALEQKWQYEKGLAGIKMDLDRSEMETRGLRIILQEHDILAPSTRSQLSDGSHSDNEAADDKLKLSISTAEAERDQARQIASQYRARATEVGDPKSADELMGSARRMDDLAAELDKQVQSNVQLRARLSEAVAKGEREQRESNGRIAEMQKRLTVMEDSVLAAQQHSENTLNNHETDVRRLEEASSPSLQRLRISVPDGKKLAPPSPLLVKSPKLTSANGSKRLTETSLLEMSRTQMLERKVKEMEQLLREAEEDVHVVVQRVNASQMEVAELQTERDAALSQMRKLQGLIIEEREKAERLMG